MFIYYIKLKLSIMNSFLKENNYIWQTSLSGHCVYGPNGKALKNKLEEFLQR